MLFHITEKSGNAKTGDIVVTTSSKETCPPACPFRNNGCYAASGPLNIHWTKLTNGERGQSFKDFCASLAALPVATFGRLNQAGDAPGRGNRINGKMLGQLAKALTGKRFFSYTHKPVLASKKVSEFIAKQNRKHIKSANENGLTLNLSANNLKHADKLKKLNIGPVVTILGKESPEVVYTPAGNKVVVCPAQTREGITCKTCQLCSRGNRSVIIGFLAHGYAKNKVSQIALT
jgi:hypothetical protein